MSNGWLAFTHFSTSDYTRRRFFAGMALLGGGLLTALFLGKRATREVSPQRPEPTETKAIEPSPAVGNSTSTWTLADYSQIKRAEDIHSNASTFVGLPVKDYLAGQKAEAGIAYRFRSNWDDDTLLPNLKSFIASPAAAEERAIVIGSWAAGDPDKKPDSVVSTLVENSSKLPKLGAIYVGDIISEEFEMSWIQQTDLSPLLEAFPKLEVFRCRGGSGLAFSKLEHGNLRALAIESGGLDRNVVLALNKARLPNLEYLELWLGTEDYGGNVKIDDLSAILSGERFPKLKYLGLRNYDQADQVAKALPSSAVVKTLEVLDLSLGTLSDQGGQALLELKSPSLESLLLYHHYMSDEMSQKLQKLGLQVDLSKPAMMDQDPEDRYVAVGE